MNMKSTYKYDHQKLQVKYLASHTLIKSITDSNNEYLPVCKIKN